MVDYMVKGNIAVLEANNPPVNALSHAVRLGLSNGIKKAQSDNNVKAIVIVGRGRTFPAGADIREFSAPSSEPWLTDVGYDIEACQKPVVAAIHGTCLGGGLEIALFCHYRVAVKTARVGFPEVAIGLIPGALGTQRLPRITGLAVAMEMISSGRHVPAEEAFRLKILDAVTDEKNVLKYGIDFAKTVINKPLEARRIRNWPVPDAKNVSSISEAAMKMVKKKYKGFEAPVNCIKAVAMAAIKSHDEGRVLERKVFQDLLTSGQARAQQYAFFAERAVTKWEIPSGSFKTAKALPIKSTAVIGAGTMGTGIAVCLLRAGFFVYLLEQNEKFLEKGVKTIQNLIMGSVKLGKMSKEQGMKVTSLLRPTMSYEDLAGVDLVIEAVYENLDLKKQIFSKLDKMCKGSTILCSNTSSLDINRIAVATKRPDKVVGTHFFAPAYHMKLLENIYGDDTSPETVATVMELGKRIGKVAVLVGSCQGFLANRMNGPYSTEAKFMVEEGALPQEVDKVLEDFGMPIGTFKVGDLSGLDISVKVNAEVAKTLGVELTTETRFLRGTRYCALNDILCKKGRLGRKAGKGWYRYEKPGGKIAMRDEEVEQILREYCEQRGIQRRKISPNEILERVLFPMINEGFKILEDGIARSPEEIDMCWLHGFSFPRYLGGPMFYASKYGLKRLYLKICEYHEKFPYSPHWVPSRLLRKLSENETPMQQWSKQVSQARL